MGIRPLEFGEGPSKKFFYLKVVLLSTAVIGGFAFSRFMPLPQKKKVPVQSAKPEKENVQSDENTIAKVKKNSQELVKEALKRPQAIAEEVLGIASTVIEEVASKSADTVGDFVFDKTIGNILEQIEKLPEEQQKKVRERICE